MQGTGTALQVINLIITVGMPRQGCDRLSPYQDVRSGPAAPLPRKSHRLAVSRLDVSVRRPSATGGWSGAQRRPGADHLHYGFWLKRTTDADGATTYNEVETFAGSSVARLESCDCTHSCYDCLRSYKNKWDHKYLDRTLCGILSV